MSKTAGWQEGLNTRPELTSGSCWRRLLQPQQQFSSAGFRAAWQKLSMA